MNGSTTKATLILLIGIPSVSANRLSMQYKGTPEVPTSGAPSGLVGSIPLKVNASTAALNPVSPFLYRNFHLSLVFSGDMVFNRICQKFPCPENKRIVQIRPLYMVGYTPRV